MFAFFTAWRWHCCSRRSGQWYGKQHLSVTWFRAEFLWHLEKKTNVPLDHLHLDLLPLDINRQVQIVPSTDLRKMTTLSYKKIAILNKVADQIFNREDKGEYSFGKQVGEQLGRVKNPVLVLRLKHAIISDLRCSGKWTFCASYANMSGSFYSPHPTYFPNPQHPHQDCRLQASL